MDRTNAGQTYQLRFQSTLDGCELETQLYLPPDKNVAAAALDKGIAKNVDGDQVQDQYGMTGDGNMESLQSKAKPRIAVVLAHPYGPLGGNMFNNVVDALWEALCNTQAVAVLRYDARCVRNEAFNCIC
jgi:predicted small lipoprotein YifL